MHPAIIHNKSPKPKSHATNSLGSISATLGGSSQMMNVSKNLVTEAAQSYMPSNAPTVAEVVVDVTAKEVEEVEAAAVEWALAVDGTIDPGTEAPPGTPIIIPMRQTAMFTKQGQANKHQNPRLAIPADQVV